MNEPFTGASGDYFTTYTNYNALGEALTVEQADGSIITNSYGVEDGWLRQTQTVSITDSMSTIEQMTERYLDPLGQFCRTIDAHDVTTELTYDVQGRLASTIIDGNAASTVSVTHDVVGNKTFISDPRHRPLSALCTTALGNCASKRGGQTPPTRSP